MATTAEQRDLLRAWEIGPIQSIAQPAAGTVNQTWLVTATTGRYALRTYRHHDRAPVAREHAIIAHVRARGLPAVGPPGPHTLPRRVPTSIRNLDRRRPLLR